MSDRRLRLVEPLTDAAGEPLDLSGLPELAAPGSSTEDFHEGMLFGVALALAGDRADLPAAVLERTTLLGAMLTGSRHPALAVVLRTTIDAGKARLGWR